MYSKMKMTSSIAPHVFAVAEKSFRSMLAEGRSQCCVISGESGAGKTESSKFLLQHLLSRAESEETGLNRKIRQVCFCWSLVIVSSLRMCRWGHCWKRSVMLLQK